jgi:hypothetical protein
MKDDIIRMAREAKLPYYYRTGDVSNLDQLEHFAALVAAAERNKLAQWMMARGYATGHGDSIEDLLQELDWQIAENWTRGMVNGVQAEREACAAVARQWDADHPASNYGGCIANLIEARGQA